MWRDILNGFFEAGGGFFDVGYGLFGGVDVAEDFCQLELIEGNVEFDICVIGGESEGLKLVSEGGAPIPSE